MTTANRWSRYFFTKSRSSSLSWQSPCCPRSNKRPSSLFMSKKPRSSNFTAKGTTAAGKHSPPVSETNSEGNVITFEPNLVLGADPREQVGVPRDGLPDDRRRGVQILRDALDGLGCVHQIALDAVHKRELLGQL